MRQIREVSGGSGYLSQNSLTVHFGLGAATQAESLIVRWPSGIAQTLGGVSADQRFTLVEAGTTGVGPAPDEVCTLELARPAPNPFQSQTCLRFALPGTTPVRLTLHDTQGRLVATLAEGVRVSGWHSLTWTGRDDRGMALSAGVYFARLTAMGETRTRKLIVLR